MAEETLGDAVLRLKIEGIEDAIRGAQDQLNNRELQVRTGVQAGQRTAAPTTSTASGPAARRGLSERELTDLVRDRIRLSEEESRQLAQVVLQLQRRISEERTLDAVVARRARQGGARENTNARETAKERRFRLNQQITALENRGVNTDRLRVKLGEVTEAIAKRRFVTAKQLGNELSRQVRLTQARAKEAERQAAAELRTARSIAASATRAASLGGASESINTRERFRERRFRLNQQIGALEARGAETDRLRVRLGEVTEAISKRQFGTAQQLSAELSRQVRLAQAKATAVERAAASEAKAARVAQATVTRNARQGGPSTNVEAAAKAESRRFAIQQKLDVLTSKGVDTTRAQAKLTASVNAELQGRFGTARQLASQADKLVTRAQTELRIEAQKTRELQRQTAEREKQAAAVIAEGKRIGSLNTSPIRGSVNTPGSPAAIEFENKLAAARQKAAEATLKAEVAEGKRIGSLNTSPVRGGLAFPGSPDFIAKTFPKLQPGTLERYAAQEQRLASARADAAAKTLLATKAEGQIERARASGINKRLSGALSSALIGGGFPLLFGQGLGASAGGLLGGLGGGALGGGFGFGASIIGTLIGSQVDKAVQSLNTLGKALDDPISNFDALRQAALFSSKGVEDTVQALIQAGDKAEAEALTRADINARFGDIGDLSEFNSALDDLKSAFVELGISIATDLVPFLTSAAKLLEDFGPKLKAALTQSLTDTVNDAADLINRGRAAVGNDPANLADFRRIVGENGGEINAEGLVNDIGIAIKSYRRFLQLRGELTLEDKKQLDILQVQTQAEEQRNRLKREAAEKAIQASREALASAQQELVFARETAALEGPALAIAQQRLAIDKARAEQAKAAAQFDTIRNDPNIKPDDAAFIEARNNLDAAANNLGIALVQGSREAKNNLQSAADAVRSALTAIFDNLDPSKQAELLADANKIIQQGLDKGIIASVPRFETIKQIRAGFGIEERLTNRGAKDLINFANSVESAIKVTDDYTQAVDQNQKLIRPPGDVGKNPNFIGISDISIENLATKIDELNQKTWSVDVKVFSDGSSDVDGNGLPRALYP